MNNNTGYFQITEPASPEMRPINDAFGRVSYVVLHPDTDPARIRNLHRDLIDEAVTMHGTIDVAELSELVCIPAWNVRRALAALGLIEFDADAQKRHNGKVKPSAVNLPSTKPLAAVDAKR